MSTLSIFAKAFRLTQDVIETHKHDRTQEALSRLEAGKQSLTALLFGEGSELQLPSSPSAQRVGKTLLDLAPTFGAKQDQVKATLTQVERSISMISQGSALDEVAEPLEQQLTSLLDGAGVSADVMPRNLLGDLVERESTDPKRANGKPDAKKDGKKDGVKDAKDAKDTQDPKKNAQKVAQKDSKNDDKKAKPGEKAGAKQAEKTGNKDDRNDARDETKANKSFLAKFKPLSSAAATAWKLMPWNKRDGKANLGVFTQKVDQTVDKVEQKVEQTVDKVEQKVEQTADKVEQRVEQTVDKIEQSVDKIEQTVDKIEQTVDNIEQTVDKVTRTVDKVAPTVDKVEQGVDKVEQTVDKVAPTVDKVEQGVDKVEQTVDKVADETVRQTVDKIDDKLERTITSTIDAALEPVAPVRQRFARGTLVSFGKRQGEPVDNNAQSDETVLPAPMRRELQRESSPIAQQGEVALQARPASAGPTADVRFGGSGLGLSGWLAKLDLESSGEVAETPGVDVPTADISLSMAGAQSPMLSARPVRMPNLVKPLRQGQATALVTKTPGADKVAPRTQATRFSYVDPTDGSEQTQNNASHTQVDAVPVAPGPQATRSSYVDPTDGSEQKQKNASNTQVDAVPTAKQTGSALRVAAARATGRRMQRAYSQKLGKNRTSTQKPMSGLQFATSKQAQAITNQKPRKASFKTRPLPKPVAPAMQTKLQAPVAKAPLPKAPSTVAPKTPVPSTTRSIAQTSPTKDTALVPTTPATDKPTAQPGQVVAAEQGQLDNAVQAVKQASVDRREQIAKTEERKVQNAQQVAQKKLSADVQKSANREARLRHGVTKKGHAAHRKAAAHSQRKQHGVRRGAQLSLASLKQQFAQYKAQQEQRLAGLLASQKLSLQMQFNASKQRQLDALAKGRDTIVNAKQAERRSLEGQIKQEKLTEDNNYRTAVATRQNLKKQVYAEHQKIKNDAINEANHLCSTGCTDFHNTGERLANDAISRGNTEAQNLIAQGKAANAGSKDGHGDMASWQNKASERRQQARQEAASIRAEYKAKADQLRADTQVVIQGHRDTETRENQLEDAACQRDLDTLQQIHDAAYRHFDSVLESFDRQCQIELDAYEDYVQTQTALIEKQTEDAHLAAVNDLEADYNSKIDGVKNDVNGKLATFETKLDGATQKELGALAKEFNELRGEIETSIGTITARSQKRADDYSAAADAKVNDINTRAQQAVDAIRAETKIARQEIEVYKKFAKSSRDTVMDRATTRANNSYIRQRAQAYNDNHSKLDASTDRTQIDANIAKNAEDIERTNQLERDTRPLVVDGPGILQNSGIDYSARTERGHQLFAEANENSAVRREVKTGRERITADNAPATRAEVLTALEPTDMNVLNGNADPGKAVAVLASLSQQELDTLYPEGSEARKQLLESAFRAAPALQDLFKAMLGTGDRNRFNKGASDPRAMALKWALDAGDKRAADAVFASLTTDAERRELDRQFANIHGASIRDSFTADAFNDNDKKELTAVWDAGRTFSDGQYSRNGNASLTEQWNQEKATREAVQTVQSYAGSDKNKLLQLRSEMFKRHAGPYLSKEDEEQHKVQLQRELEQFDSTVFNVSGQSMEKMDTDYTTGKTREALLATSHRVVIDPNEPDFTRPEGNWNKFGVKLLERSIEKNDYDTRLNENFLGKLPPDKRKEFLAQYQEQTGRSYIDDVNANVRTSAAKQTERPEISWKKSKIGDVNDLESPKPGDGKTVPASEIDADSLIELANNGEVPDALRMLQLKNGRGRGDEADQKELSSKINRVTMTGQTFENVTSQYGELEKKYKLATTGNGKDDLLRDVNALLQPRDARKAAFEMETAGAERTPEWDGQRRTRIFTNDSNMPDSLRAVLEGPAGEELQRSKKALDEQLAQMRQDGTSNLTREKIAELMMTQDPPPFTAEQLARYASYQTRSDAVVVANETVAQSYEANVRYAAMYAATGVVVVGTVVLTGPLGPVLAGVISSAAGGLATMGIKQVAFGSDYSAKELGVDATSVIVDGIVGGVVAGGAVNAFAKRAVARFGQAWARQMLAEAIQMTAVNTGSELTKTLLDPSTYVGNEAQVRERILARVKKAALTGAVTGGTKGLMNSGATKYIGVAEASQLDRGIRTGIEVTSNVSGAATTATSASEVLNAALLGLSAYAKPKTPVNEETALAPTRKSVESRFVAQSKATEVATLRELFKQGAKIRAQNSVDDAGRRVYDVTMPNGDKVVVKGPANTSGPAVETTPSAKPPADKPSPAETKLLGPAPRNASPKHWRDVDLQSLPYDGMSRGAVTFEDYKNQNGGKVTEAERARAEQSRQSEAQMTLQDQRDALLTGSRRTTREMIAAIESDKLPRYVARVGPSESFDRGTFANPGRNIAFATEPADLRGLAPVEMLKAVGWQQKDIDALVANNANISVVIYDTWQTKQEPVGLQRMNWGSLAMHAIGDAAFNSALEAAGITRDEMPALLGLLSVSAPSGEIRSGNAELQQKAAMVRLLLERHYSANPLFTGMGATMDPSGKGIRTREVMVQDNTGFELGKDNSVEIELGPIGTGLVKREPTLPAKRKL